MTYAGKNLILTSAFFKFCCRRIPNCARLTFTSRLISHHNTAPQAALLKNVVASTRLLRFGQEAEVLDAVEFCGVGVLKGEFFPVWPGPQPLYRTTTPQLLHISFSASAREYHDVWYSALVDVSYSQSFHVGTADASTYQQSGENRREICQNVEKAWR